MEGPCEFWRVDELLNGWTLGHCVLEEKDRSFDAIRDCIKRTCKLHTISLFDLDYAAE